MEKVPVRHGAGSGESWSSSDEAWSSSGEAPEDLTEKENPAKVGDPAEASARGSAGETKTGAVIFGQGSGRSRRGNWQPRLDRRCMDKALEDLGNRGPMQVQRGEP